MNRIVALIPAHNEERCIGEAVRSMLSQTRPPDEVVVVADNCTDHTVREAVRAGAAVLVTKNNTAKKAGALNQALDHYLASADYIVTQDADTVLIPEWIENALEAVEREPDTGAVSGRYQARDGRGMISLLQKIEYHQVHRRIARKGGYIQVLSGTATMFRADVLRELHTDRGHYYDESSLTEDFEITVALRMRGYVPRSYKTLVTITDVMETWQDLSNQRLRWQRGTLETLTKYGFNKVTRKLWLGQVASYGMTFIYLLIAFAWGVGVGMGFTFEPKWLLVTPVFVLAQVVETRRLGTRPTLLAASLVPMWAYDSYRLYIYWRALGRIASGSTRSWA